jgi:hypothetical protein
MGWRRIFWWRGGIYEIWIIEDQSFKTVNRIRRVRKNLQQAMMLAWTASPRLLMKFTLLGMFNAIMPPISVYLSARLVNVAEGRW